MEYAAFDPQLSDTDVRELGRMTVNFGYAELLLDWILLAALNVRNLDAIRTLISPLATRKKVELITAQLPKCPNATAVALIKKAMKRIEGANDDRNQIMHGYWALGAGGMTVHYRKDPAKSRVTPPTIEKLCDEVAIATRELFEAYNLLNRSPLNPGQPHVLKPNADGSFSVIVRAQGSA
jgi:hypothetical protein